MVLITFVFPAAPYLAEGYLMSKISCPGYFPADEAGGKKILHGNLGLLMRSTDLILQRPEMYFCSPPCCWISTAYVSGDDQLALGWVLEGYRNGILIETCPACDGDLFITSLGGSPLSGSNSVYGKCLSCQGALSVKGGPCFSERYRFIYKIRKEKPKRRTDYIPWTGQGGYSFLFSNPKERKTVVTTMLYPQALSLEQVVAALQAIES
jgi:hypothetical protein